MEPSQSTWDLPPHSTAPEVRLLLDEFGVPEEDTLITYKQVEKTIHCKKASVRFRTVTDAWRRLLEREYKRLMLTVMKVGFKAATPAERERESCSQIGKGHRRVIHAVKLDLNTDLKRLDVAARARVSHRQEMVTVQRLMLQTQKPGLIKQLRRSFQTTLDEDQEPS